MKISYPKYDIVEDCKAGSCGAKRKKYLGDNLQRFVQLQNNIYTKSEIDLSSDDINFLLGYFHMKDLDRYLEIENLKYLLSKEMDLKNKLNLKLEKLTTFLSDIYNELRNQKLYYYSDKIRDLLK